MQDRIIWSRGAGLLEGGTEGHSLCCERVSDSYTTVMGQAEPKSRLADMNKHCLEEFRAHWNCLENYNHQFFQCRRPERVLNRCVFNKIVRIYGWNYAMVLILHRDWRRSFQIRLRARHRSISETTRFWRIRGACSDEERRTSAS